MDPTIWTWQSQRMRNGTGIEHRCIPGHFAARCKPLDVCLSMIFSENRFTPRIKSGAGCSGSCSTWRSPYHQPEPPPPPPPPPESPPPDEPPPESLLLLLPPQLPVLLEEPGGVAAAAM